MRILWTGVAAWASSGYGVATKNIITRLQKLGHEIRLLTYYGLHGARVTWNGIEHWPVKAQQFGSDVIGSYIAEFQPDVVITLYDQWVIPSYQQLGSVWLPYVVLHYEPMEPKLREAVQGAWRCWSLCDWAAGLMRDEGMDARTVPLGVDTNVYRPLLGLMDANGNIFKQENLKQMLGCPPDHFLIGMVAANRDFRKALEPQFRVFADFHRKYKDTHLFIKTNASAAEGGWDLPLMCTKLFGLKKGGQAPVTYPADDQTTVDSHTLCTFFNAMDLYLCCSVSEGYGLPVVEAQACFPAVTDVAAEDVVRATRRCYSGTMVHIETDYGAFDATADHPLWSANGWIPAGRVVRGTPLLYTGGTETRRSNDASQGILRVYQGRIGDADAAVSGPHPNRSSRDHGEDVRVRALAKTQAWPDQELGTNHHAEAGNAELRPQEPPESLWFLLPGCKLSAALSGIATLPRNQAPAHAARGGVLPGAPSGTDRGSSARDAEYISAEYRGAQFTPVRSVSAYEVVDLPVFNLTTASGMYRAAGFLVHNCGIPAAVTAFSAMNEVCGSGWKLPYKKFLTSMYSFGAAVDEEALWKALEEAYNMRGTPKYAEMKRKAREHALQYDWDKVVCGTMQRELTEWLEEREL